MKSSKVVIIGGSAAGDGQQVHLIDCDVEEPDCPLFVQPAFTAELNVRFRHPVVLGEVVTVRTWIDRSHPV